MITLKINRINLNNHRPIGMNLKIKNLRNTALILCGLLMTSGTSAVWAKKEMPEGWFGYKNSQNRGGVFEKESIGLPFKIVWSYKIEDKSNGFVDYGPVAANGKIYTPDGLNNVMALNASDGTLIWKKQVISNVFTVSLSEDGKILFVTTAITTKPTPTLFAIDAETGDDLWDNLAFNQPAVGGMEGAPVIQDGKIYAGYLQYEGKGGVAAYDVRDGKMVWQWEVPRVSPYSPLSYAKGRLYVGFENKSIYCLSASDGKIVWNSAPLPDIIFMAPLVMNDRVYFGAGTAAYSFDASRGSLIWKKELDGELGHGSFSYFEDTLYAVTRDSSVIAMQAATGSILWRQNLGMGPIESSPLIDADKRMLYIATQENKLAALELSGGKIAGEMRFSEDPRGVWKSTPALYNGKLYVGSLDRTFYAVE